MLFSVVAMLPTVGMALLLQWGLRPRFYNVSRAPCLYVIISLAEVASIEQQCDLQMPVGMQTSLAGRARSPMLFCGADMFRVRSAPVARPEFEKSLMWPDYEAMRMSIERGTES